MDCDSSQKREFNRDSRSQHIPKSQNDKTVEQLKETYSGFNVVKTVDGQAEEDPNLMTELDVAFLPPQPYQYKPFQQDNEIRLLKVEREPSSPQKWKFSLIRCTIYGAPPYETVSYVWGSTLRDRYLHLNDGTVLAITENLEVAIPNLAGWCETGYLWIDQICIDQATISERNHQVKLMGQIYCSGSCVLVWLGCFDTEVLRHDDVLGALCNWLKEGVVPSGVLEKVVLQHIGNIMLDDLEQKRPNDPLIDKPTTTTAIRQLYKCITSEWFTRGWVYQEMVLSRKSKIILGDYTVSLQGLHYLCKAITQFEIDWLKSNIHAPVMDTPGRRIIPLMFRDWQEWHKHHEITEPPKINRSFDEILSTVAPHMSFTDSRDRVYAFLGLNREFNIQIEPSYQDTSRHIMISTAMAIINGTRRLDIFERVCREGDGDAERPFVRKSPSWVLDFTRKEHVAPYTFPTMPKTSIESGTDCMYPHTGEVNQVELHVHGKVIDRIKDYVDENQPRHPNNAGFDFEHWVHAAQLAWKDTKRQVPEPNKQSVYAAFLAQGHYSIKGRHDLVHSVLDDKTMPEVLPFYVGYFKYEIEKPFLSKEMMRMKNRSDVRKRMRQAFANIYYVSWSRHLMITEEGRLMLGSTVEPGDEICVLHGCRHPVVLRANGDGTYSVQETCFLEGWMDPWGDGKVWWKEEEGDEFVLV